MFEAPNRSHHRIKALLNLERGPALILLSVILASTFLSYFYSSVLLEHLPRTIDASYYRLQARLFSEGSLSFSAWEGSPQLRGRFLTAHLEGADQDPQLGVIFPPGYALFLSLFYRLGTWQLSSIFLNIALLSSVYLLAKALSKSIWVPPFAALLCTLSLSLRFHLSETMSHGFCAVLILLLSYLRWWQYQSKLSNTALLINRGICGALLAWLFCSRPITALAILPALAWGFRLSKPALPSKAQVSTPSPFFQWRALASHLPYLLGAFPFLAFYFIYQQKLTGSYFGNSQLQYYALADSPAQGTLNCFRLGFSQDRGCQYEHQYFLNEYLPHGFQSFDALHVSLRRILGHFGDALNHTALYLTIPAALYRLRHEAVSRYFIMLFFGMVLAYAPFYFDGNIPLGGARFLSELIPFELLLLALACGKWLSQLSTFKRYSSASALTAVIALAALPRIQNELQRLSGASTSSALQSCYSLQAEAIFVDRDDRFAEGFDSKTAIRAWSKSPKDTEAKSPITEAKPILILRSRDKESDRQLIRRWQQISQRPHRVAQLTEKDGEFSCQLWSELESPNSSSEKDSLGAPPWIPFAVEWPALHLKEAALLPLRIQLEKNQTKLPSLFRALSLRLSPQQKAEFSWFPQGEGSRLQLLLSPSKALSASEAAAQPLLLIESATPDPAAKVQTSSPQETGWQLGSVERLDALSPQGSPIFLIEWQLAEPTASADRPPLLHLQFFYDLTLLAYRRL